MDRKIMKELINDIKRNRLSETVIKLINVLDNDIGKTEQKDGSFVLYDSVHIDFTIRLFRVLHNTIYPNYNNIVLLIGGENLSFYFDNPTSGKFFDDIQTAIKSSKYRNYEIK